MFAAIEWRRFEAVCEALFAQAGFTTKSQSHGADGGVDIWLFSKNADGPATIVQCKHWNNKAVGVRDLRRFFGMMASHKLSRGTYVTTSTFTEEALLFAKANGINTMDGSRLLKQIVTRTDELQRHLLEWHTKGSIRGQHVQAAELSSLHAMFKFAHFGVAPTSRGAKRRYGEACADDL